jgi:hypothetical protein
VQLTLRGFLTITNKALSFYQVEIPLDQLQNTIAERFPIQKKKYLFSLTLADPLVRLEPTTNLIGIEFTAFLAMPGNLITQWRGLIYGSLQYDRSKGEFYLLNLTIHKTDREGNFYRQKGMTYVLVENMLNRVFATTPIYRLRADEDIKHSLTKFLLKSVAVRRDSIVLKLGLY